MTGFLCALGIAGGTAFAVGWNEDADAPGAWPLVIGGASLMAVAGISGLIRFAV